MPPRVQGTLTLRRATGEDAGAKQPYFVFTTDSGAGPAGLAGALGALGLPGLCGHAMLATRRAGLATAPYL